MSFLLPSLTLIDVLVESFLRPCSLLSGWRGRLGSGLWGNSFGRL